MRENNGPGGMSLTQAGGCAALSAPYSARSAAGLAGLYRASSSPLSARPRMRRREISKRTRADQAAAADETEETRPSEMRKAIFHLLAFVMVIRKCE